MIISNTRYLLLVITIVNDFSGTNDYDNNNSDVFSSFIISQLLTALIFSTSLRFEVFSLKILWILVFRILVFSSPSTRERVKYCDGGGRVGIPKLLRSLEKIWVQKNIREQKNFWSKKKFGSKNILGQKNFGSKKMLGPKKFWI